MAERRMISRKIVDTDEFVDMPVSARLLYYELNWRADDDGFVSSPKKITRTAGCSEDDLKILIVKQFIIPFNSGVVLIRDWRIHNYIRSDRYSETLCKDEKEQIFIDPNNRYLQCNTRGIPNVIPTVNTGKDRLGKDRLEIEGEPGQEDKPPAAKKKHKYGEFDNVLLTDEDLQKLKDKFPDYEKKIEEFSEGLELKGYVYKNHYLAILKWAKNEKSKQQGKQITTEYSKPESWFGG